MSGHKRRKSNIPMIVAAVLFCTILLTAHFMDGLYAKYKTSDTGDDSARVITFSDITITETGDFNSEGKLILVPGVNLTKQATVDFGGSEAATYVFVKVELGPKTQWTYDQSSMTFSCVSGSDAWIQWKMENGWTYLEDSDGVFYQELSPNETLVAEPIIAENGTLVVSENISRTQISKASGISIAFEATAVQSSGFETVQDAWASVGAK